MSENKEKLVKCPFYKRDDSQKITCEGVVDESTLSLNFTKKDGKRTQFTVFCCNTQNYKCCEIYRMLMSEKYCE